MWTIEKGGDFAELGYTFSNPRIGLVRTPGGPRPAVMFAGGYDTNKDARGAVGSDDSEGNAMYVVDAETGVNSALQHADFGYVTSNCLQSAVGCNIDLQYGWRLGLEEPGEKVLATPLTIVGKVFFTTYLPHSGTGATACSPSEGVGRLYAVSLQNATAVINYDSSDDIPGNPDEPTSKDDRSVELQSLGIPAEVISVPPNKILRPDLQIDDVDATTRWRTFWFLQEDGDL